MSIPIGGKTLSPLNSLSLEIKVFQQPFYFVFFVFLILVFYCLVERREEQTRRKRFRNVLATAGRTRGKKERKAFLSRQDCIHERKFFLVTFVILNFWRISLMDEYISQESCHGNWKVLVPSKGIIKPVYQEFTALLVRIYLYMILFGFWFFQTTESYN